MGQGFSICLIVKNEEKRLDKCLEPLASLGMEIVIVDTGSTDDTKQIASKYTDRIFDFQWINDFSAARNFAMEKASNDFVLFVDADEYLEDINLSEIKGLIIDYPDAIGRITRRSKCRTGNGYAIFVDLVERLFDRRIFYYTGRIHEQVTRRDGAGLTGYEIPFTVFHDGYVGTIEELKAKGNRNIQLLEEELKDNPNDPYTYYQLGQSYVLFDDYVSAIPFYEKACELNPDKSLIYVKELVISTLGTYHKLKRFDDMLKLAGDYTAFGQLADYNVSVGNAYLGKANPIMAADYFYRALNSTECQTEGMNSFIPFYSLACIHEYFENYSDAVYCLEMAQDYTPAKDKLNEIKSKNLQQQDKKVSIICVVDHSNSNIDSFLNGLVKQTLGMARMEIILIDKDCQEPVSGKLHKFESLHEDNVILIANEEDDVAENLFSLGISYSSGQYLYLTDGMSTLLPDGLRMLCKGCDTFAADAGCCTTYNLNSNMDEVINHNIELKQSPVLETIITNMLDPKCMAVNLMEGNNRLAVKSSPYFKAIEEGLLINADMISQLNAECIGESIVTNGKVVFISETPFQYR